MSFSVGCAVSVFLRICAADPYGKGWIIVIEASDLDSDLDSLFHGDGVVDFVEAQVKKAEEERSKA